MRSVEVFHACGLGEIAGPIEPEGPQGPEGPAGGFNYGGGNVPVVPVGGGADLGGSATAQQQAEPTGPMGPS